MKAHCDEWLIIFHNSLLFSLLHVHTHIVASYYSKACDMHFTCMCVFGWAHAWDMHVLVQVCDLHACTCKCTCTSVYLKLFEHVAHLAWSGLILYALRNMLRAGTHNMLLWHFVYLCMCKSMPFMLW